MHKMRINGKGRGNWLIWLTWNVAMKMFTVCVCVSNKVSYVLVNFCIMQACLTPRPTGVSITDTDYRPSALATVSSWLFISLSVSVRVYVVGSMSMCDYHC